ncbi:MAG: cytochrome c1, partial [Pseudomonadota bacterium]|nr:cytochrome c1 [Pseudomonadota bacterium]
MNRISALIFSVLLNAGLSLSGAEAAGDAKHPEAVDWSFNGLFGTYDRDSLRRGYKVYTEVCAACHSMEQLRFRNLSQPGGPEFSELEVKAIAAGFT